MKNKSEYLQSWTSAKRAATKQNGAPVKKQGINVQNYANASSPYSEFQIEMRSLVSLPFSIIHLDGNTDIGSPEDGKTFLSYWQLDATHSITLGDIAWSVRIYNDAVPVTGDDLYLDVGIAPYGAALSDTYDPQYFAAQIPLATSGGEVSPIQELRAKDKRQVTMYQGLLNDPQVTLPDTARVTSPVAVTYEVYAEGTGSVGTALGDIIVEIAFSRRVKQDLWASS
jgi:hypothetical protein